MRRRPFAFAGSLSLSLTLALAAMATAADDVVLIPNSTIKAPGGRFRGQITAENPAELKIKPTAGPDQTVPLDQIATITYEGTPGSFALGETRESSGQIAEAADLFKKAATEASGKPFVVQAAKSRRTAILTDLALASPAKAKEAIDELEAFLQAYPTSRHTGAVLENLVKLHLQKDDIAKATAAVALFKEKVPSSPERVAILDSKVLTKSGKFDQALKALDTVIASNKGNAKGRDAQLAKAECLVGLKKYDDALATVQEVIKESPPEAYEIQAVAHNTLGDCYRAARRPKDALLAYLKTDILYDRDKEQHPKALAMIEQLFRELKVDVRADEVHERLKQQYPQSPYLVGAPKR